MTTNIMNTEAEVDHFLILTYENQFIFIVLDNQQAQSECAN